MRLLDKKYEKIIQQAQEIGSLQQRITELENHLGKSALSANTGDTANVG